MSYKLIYTRTAFKDVKKLDIIVKKRIRKKIEEYQIDPLTHAKRLINPLIGSYRWRIGDYRVIFDIEKDRIIILRIGHRREIYER